MENKTLYKVSWVVLGACLAIIAYYALTFAGRSLNATQFNFLHKTVYTMLLSGLAVGILAGLRIRPSWNTKTCFFHIGCALTGFSALNAALWMLGVMNEPEVSHRFAWTVLCGSAAAAVTAFLKLAWDYFMPSH
jgi:hypothetical protein